MDITELLAFSAKNGASDLHLSAGLPPMIRVDGEVRRINLPAMEHKDVVIMKSFGKLTFRLKFPVLPVFG